MQFVSSRAFLSNRNARLASPLKTTNVTAASGYIAARNRDENGLTPLNFDANFPEYRRAKVNTMYKDAYTYATAGYDATTRSQDPGYLRYLRPDENRYVASTLDAFKVGAEQPEGSKIPEVKITWGMGHPLCHQLREDSSIMYMFLTPPGGQGDYYGPGSQLYICPQADQLSMLGDHNCDYAHQFFSRTTTRMLTAGAAFLHEFLHYDALTWPRNWHKILDREIQGSGPLAGQKAYGPYLSMMYRDPPLTQNSARDNDDNYVWMCIESFWRSYCPGFQPLPPVDERIRQ